MLQAGIRHHPGQRRRHWISGVFRCTSLSDIAIPGASIASGHTRFSTPPSPSMLPQTAQPTATPRTTASPLPPWKSSMPYGTAAPEPSQSPLPSDSGPIGPYSVVLGLRVHWLKSDGPPLRPGTIIVPRWGINCLESNLSFRHGKSNYVPVGRTGLRQIQFGLQKVLLSIRAKQTTKGSAFSTLISQSPPF